ncbi:MAG: DUF2249 domain-containing protein [Sporichthyaceae bacterium]
MTVTTDVVGAITSHHAELKATLTARVDDVLAAARTGQPHGPAVAGLSALLAADIVPHARAEEDVLYAAATAANLRPLVTGMLFEHETLLALGAELPAAKTSVDAAAVARSLRDVFVGHVRRENELLIPALAADPAVDLVALLPVMEERFATYRDPARQLLIAGPSPSGPDRELDLRAEPHAQRHDLIFQTYAATPAGLTFVLVNDHDPRRLYDQFQAEQSGRFSWTYLESGPEVWRVLIGRTAG